MVQYYIDTSVRINKIRDNLSTENIDAFFITNFYNILYFTGFKTLVPHEREAFLLITRKNVYVFSDGRYFDNFKFEIFNSKLNELNIKCKLLTPEMGLIKHLQEIVVKEKISKMGFEKEDLKWGEYNAFQKTLKTELIPQDKVGVKIRAIKEHDEIEKIQSACRVGDACLSDISKLLRVGMNEKEIAWKIEAWIREKGYEVAFDPIVAIDANAAVPHYDTQNGNGVIKDSSIILIDMGVRYQGYNSDITRMFFMGKQSDEVVNAYQKLFDVQTKTIQYISKAKKLSDVDMFCRKLITDNRLLIFPHSTGHGVGLEVHEYPKISIMSEDILQTGNVFTIEPGIYFTGKWGMRIEDTVLVADKNNIKSLTAFPRRAQLL